MLVKLFTIFVFKAPPKGPNQPYDPLYWDEFMVPDYGGYSASEGGRGKGGPRGAPPGGRMGGGPMGMRGGVGGGGRYWRNYIMKINFFS